MTQAFHSSVFPEGKPKLCSHKGICMHVHAAFFVSVPKQEQPKYPSTSEWINKWQYIHTTGTLLGHKKGQMIDLCNMDELLNHYAGERSYRKKSTYYMLPVTENFRKCVSLICSDRKQIRGWPGEEWREGTEHHDEGAPGHFWGWWEHWFSSLLIVSQVYTYVKSKYVQSVVLQIYIKYKDQRREWECELSQCPAEGRCSKNAEDTYSHGNGCLPTLELLLSECYTRSNLYT